MSRERTPSAHYFPVDERPLEMAPGLARFGSDFGLGARDGAYFQVDERYDAYLAEKRRAPSSRRFLAGDDREAEAARAEALGWMRATLAREHPPIADAVAQDQDALDPFDAIARHVQEDFAVLTAGAEDRGRTVALDVRLPSGWRPERLRDASFDAIHAPVPGFPAHEKASRAMVRAMVDRGPYVRFVWTVSASDALDQHPERGDRRALWEDTARVFFRVERQVSVPLPKTRSSVFLIRLYVTPIEALTSLERERLVHALRVMPPEVRAYKSLPPAEVFERALTRALEG